MENRNFLVIGFMYMVRMTKRRVSDIVQETMYVGVLRQTIWQIGHLKVSFLRNQMIQTMRVKLIFWLLMLYVDRMEDIICIISLQKWISLVWQCAPHRLAIMSIMEMYAFQTEEYLLQNQDTD